MNSHVSLIKHLGVPPATWFIVWDAVMNEDALNLDAVLNDTGWNVKSSDNWQLYDIIARFKRWKCMKVLLAKVPLKYLQFRYEKERNIPYGKVLMGLIRNESLKRSYIKVLLRVNIPDDIIGVVCGFIN